MNGVKMEKLLVALKLVRERHCGKNLRSQPLRLRQEDHKFQASLGYITRPCLKNTQQNKTKM
jgi:hypothetical protein